jgi:glutamine cyclotransferase
VRILVLALLALVVAAAAPGSSRPAADPPAQALRVEILGRVPHDRRAFTQGLAFVGDRLYESTGLYGASSVRELDARSGRIVRRRELPARLFGEGLAAAGGRLVQLTWREGEALVWDAATLRRGKTFRYAGQGWGLCHDGRRFVQSDGSSRLTFRDPATFAARGSVQVTLSGDAGSGLGLEPGPVPELNELECVRGRVYANVWTKDAILVIDPATGRVESVIDASRLPRPEGPELVLNGIAFRSGTGLLVTGKGWPWLYRVRLVAR